MEKVIDDLNAPKGPQLSREKIERIMDEQTVFGLACLMMDIHVGTLIKNKNMVANAFMKSGVLLQNNPGFPERFKKAQQAVKDHLKTEGPPKPGTMPTPADVVLGDAETTFEEATKPLPLSAVPRLVETL